ncbi:MAG: LysE/ArgO family amino acid transporter [Oscillospiraceae bacterium]
MGLAYVAPIGLQNLFVINTALTQPKKRVYATALIVIFFDVTLGLACFFGIGALMQASIWLEMIVLLVGSLIVIWIGIGSYVPRTIPRFRQGCKCADTQGYHHRLRSDMVQSSGSYRRKYDAGSF